MAVWSVGAHHTVMYYVKLQDFLSCVRARISTHAHSPSVYGRAPARARAHPQQPLPALSPSSLYIRLFRLRYHERRSSASLRPRLALNCDAYFLRAVSLTPPSPCPLPHAYTNRRTRGHALKHTQLHTRMCVRARVRAHTHAHTHIRTRRRRWLGPTRQRKPWCATEPIIL